MGPDLPVLKLPNWTTIITDVWLFIDAMTEKRKKNGSEQRSFLCWNEKVVPIGLLPSPNEFHFPRHFVYLLSARHNRKQSDGFLSSRMVYTGHGKWTTSKVLYDALSRSRECLGPNKWCNHSSFRLTIWINSKWFSNVFYLYFRFRFDYMV